MAATKDEERRPVATVWRPVLRVIANAWVAGDDSLERLAAADPRVESPPTQTAWIRRSITEWDEPLLAELPEESWDSSVCGWMGTHWHVLVDLWTPSGRCDLVLFVDVYEAANDFRYKTYSVYVP